MSPASASLGELAIADQRREATQRTAPNRRIVAKPDDKLRPEAR